MKCYEIIELAQVQTEEDYDNDTWIGYINACLDDLTPIVKLLNKKDGIAITPTNGQASVELSSDPDLAGAHSIAKVYFKPNAGTMAQLRRLTLSNTMSKGWQLTDTDIIYQNIGDAPGTSRVDFYRRLKPVSSVNDDLTTVAGLPPEYHSLVVLFCVAKCQQKEEELEDANTAYAEYLAGKKQLRLTRIWEMEPHMRKHVKRATIASLLGGGGA